MNVDLEEVEVFSLKQLRGWFEKHHQQAESIWLITFKKAVPEKYLSNADVVDTCVCFGWIDGRRKKLDESRTMQLLSPRKTAHWAKSYQERYTRLEREGLLHPAGIAKADEAKASGAWDEMKDVDALIAPADLTEALAKSPPAAENYERFPDSAKRDILRWIQLAKKPETRARRIIETVSKARVNRRASGTGAKS
ncbi:MAG: YdeI/OmpD-associated family protein [Verrucomicrobiota bacterium]